MRPLPGLLETKYEFGVVELGNVEGSNLYKLALAFVLSSKPL